MSSNNNDEPGLPPQAGPGSNSSGSSNPPPQAGAPPQPQPTSKKQSASASNQNSELRRTPSSSESAAEWAKRVHQIQFSRLTEEDRQALQRRADKAAELHAKAKKMAMVKQRVNESKTVSYNALQQSSAWRPEEQSTRSMGTVDFMNAREQHWTHRSMEMVPIEARRAAPISAPAVVTREEDEALMRDDSEGDAPLPMDALVGGEGAPLPIVVNANLSEADVLMSLRVEPNTDEECASKFLLYETFSAKLSAIRTDVETLLQETLPELPPIPREAVAASMKRLDDREHQGIFDQSRYWFVHDMMQKAMSNSDVMKKISNDVTVKVKLVSEMQQTDCPICLAPFVVPSRRDGSAEDASGQSGAVPVPARDESDDPVDPVVPITLGCCHKVCEGCWDHWCALRGGPANAFCPLCRQVDFVRALQGEAD